MIKSLVRSLALVLMISMVSCGNIERLMKERDYPAIYEAAVNLYKDGRYGKAASVFSSIEQIFEGSTKADTLKYYLASSYFNQRDYVNSSTVFDQFRKQYTRSAFVEEAEFYYALSYYMQAPNSDLDQTPTESAILAFNEFTAHYPSTPRADTAQIYIEELYQRLYDKSLEIGEVYYNIGAYNSAITSYKNALKKYPETPHREEIVYKIVKANYLFARKSVESKQRERYINTIDAAYNFKSEYSESEYVKDVDRILQNAERLSKGERILNEFGEELELSEKQILKGAKHASKLADKVIDGSITPEEAKALNEQYIKKMGERTSKKNAHFGTDNKAVTIAVDGQAPIKDDIGIRPMKNPDDDAIIAEEEERRAKKEKKKDNEDIEDNEE